MTNPQAVIISVVGFVQGVYLVPLIIAVPGIIMKAVSQWKSNDELVVWKSFIYLSGIIFFIFATGAFGMIWIDFISFDENRSTLTKLWGRSLFAGLAVFFIFGIVEEEYRKFRR